MKNYLQVLLLLAPLFIFNACKKYPEGGRSSSINKKLDGGLNEEYNKQWKLTLYEVNGIDSTSSFKKGKSHDRFSDYQVEIERDNRKEKTFFLRTEVTSFRMKVGKDKSTMTISPDEEVYTDAVNCYRSNICERNIFMPYKTSDNTFNWKIRKLTSEELIITLEGQKSYRIGLKHLAPED